MAKKVYPASQYYIAGGIALAFGVGLLTMGSYLYGGVFGLVGAVLLGVGLSKRAPTA
ncbi:MAG: hypothetical protein QOD77_391 [Thermoplasmata archaeon]|jgi:hypothetical protein|nr:hypothetical protein [Thermoplasmata archaeon]